MSATLAPLSDAGLQRSAAERTAAVHQGIGFAWRCTRRCCLEPANAPRYLYCEKRALTQVRERTGEEAFWKFSALLMDEQEQFFDVNTYELSRRQIYEK